MNEIKSASGIDFELDLQPRRPGDPPYLCADVSRIEKVLGWKAKQTLAEIISSAWLSRGR
jgi:UDP-glucose 4-epimerase